MKVGRRPTHGAHKTRLYRIYWCMKTRCNNPNHNRYMYYGAQGVMVEWLTFEAFRDWALANGYRDDLTIDRWPDNEGNYSSDNCRWATYSEQAYNRRKPNV